MKYRKGILLLTISGLLCACGNENTYKSEEVDKTFYDDVFDGEKLLLERNLQITIDSTFQMSGQIMTSKRTIDFNNGKARFSFQQSGRKDGMPNYIDAKIENNILKLDWYVTNYGESEFLGYSISKLEFENVNYSELIANYCGLIIDVNYEDLTFNGNYYEVKNINREVDGSILDISSYKFYFDENFAYKLALEGTVIEDEKSVPFKQTVSYSKFNQISFDLPTNILR